ncbi:MAG TPA: methyltransferase domain-containing protein [Longimicrobiaceae bacterium]|nr:methyltransferase domain-containing protein [Longimicrobiaceae bacterium]
MNKNDKLLFARYAREHFTRDVRVLEIGPDAHPSSFQGVVGHDVAAWDTLDFHTRTDVPLTYRATVEYSYPVPDASYDVVLSANVIEHVPRIWVWMKELARICRPGGHVVTINPISWHYHESPIDCWRIYPAGMRALCEDSGLEVVTSEWGSMDLQWLERISPAKLRRKYFWQRLSGVFVMWNAATRLPPEGSYDAITVARKPADAPSSAGER